MHRYLGSCMRTGSERSATGAATESFARCSPSPAFWSAFGPPARCIFLKGNKGGIGRTSPLREMTSAAYDVGRDSIADGAAVGCPVSPFFASTAWLGVLPGEERAHPARPA